MDSRQEAQLLIDQLAGEIDLAGLAFDEAGQIELQVGDGLLVTMAVDPAAGALLLVGNVGGPVDGLPAGLLLGLLAANGAAGAGGGLNAAVDPTTRHVVLQQELALRGLDYASFSDALKAMLAEQDRLSGEVEASLSSTFPGGTHGQEGIGSGLAEGGMRV